MNDMIELNIDGLVGPTHHYAGLAAGNIASIHNAKKEANPLAAALQGIEKMRLLHTLGIPLAIFPPHPRPNLRLLHQLGFRGTPTHMIQSAYKSAPELLSAAFSASSMWMANAATVSPATDTQDGKLHFTAANLISNLHRHQETAFTEALLRFCFADPRYFIHHSPLARTLTLSDEGAANHTRLALTHQSPGIHLFTYNKQMLPINNKTLLPKKYPARQTREASEAIARIHGLSPHHVIFAQQNPHAVDAGVFHNDVIAVGNESLLLLHESAFLDQPAVLNALNHALQDQLQIIEISSHQLSLKEAVDSYFFNSQFIRLPNHELALIAPLECEKNTRVLHCIQTIRAQQNNPIDHVYFLDLKQSMQNGGGPACLRLRIPISTESLTTLHAGIRITTPLLDTLSHCIKKHYRTSLTRKDLTDPDFLYECEQTFAVIMDILDLPLTLQDALYA